MKGIWKMTREHDADLVMFAKAKAEKAQADALKSSLATLELLARRQEELTKDLAKQSAEHYENHELQHNMILHTLCGTIKALGGDHEFCEGYNI